MLAACSSDGYITFIIFEKNELGNPISPEGLIENVRNYILQHNSIDITKSILNNSTMFLYISYNFICAVVHRFYNFRSFHLC